MTRTLVLATLVAGGALAGVAAAAEPALRPAPLEAYATARSYVRGGNAEIVLLGAADGVRVTVLRTGAERTNRMPAQALLGTPVHARVSVAHGIATVRIGSWPSGLYAARVAQGRLVAYAPFVVRPRRLGLHDVAVVLPTNTWQAYNFRDANGDGVGDTWYADPRQRVRLERPFGGSGVPPHFAQYDLGFLRWLVRTGKQVDVLSDDDLERIASGDRLARLYRLVVFAGHEEYVTTHAYDVVRRFRDLGGNLMFLSANDFFYRVRRNGSTLERAGRWRDLGRPEAALVGVQYLDWNEDRWPNAPYVVANVRRAPWLWRGTGLRTGDRFGNYGIEIDTRAASSPPGIRVLATVPNVFGRGRSAEMTYYETTRGARVFAAGTMGFGGSATWPPVSRLLENLWRHLDAA